MSETAEQQRTIQHRLTAIEDAGQAAWKETWYKVTAVQHCASTSSRLTESHGDSTSTYSPWARCHCRPHAHRRASISTLAQRHLGRPALRVSPLTMGTMSSWTTRAAKPRQVPAAIEMFQLVSSCRRVSNRRGSAGSRQTDEPQADIH
eukprot:1161299-Pelagomonas_calceolata.AAC.7